jgi:hypothetical protein
LRNLQFRESLRKVTCFRALMRRSKAVKRYLCLTRFPSTKVNVVAREKRPLGAQRERPSREREIWRRSGLLNGKQRDRLSWVIAGEFAQIGGSINIERACEAS